jgi:hypothetical protein
LVKNGNLRCQKDGFGIEEWISEVRFIKIDIPSIQTVA